VPVPFSPLSAFPRAFELLAVLRSAPAFHPDGVLYEGRAEVRGHGPLSPGEVDCLVRISKGIGTPRGVGDLLGIAVRLLHDQPVDVLGTTAPGGDGWRRYLLTPRRTWSGATLTSLMWWRSPTGERLQVVVQAPDGLDSPEPDVLLDLLPVTFTLRVVGRAGEVQAGTILVERRSRLPRPDFDPVLHPPLPWRLGPRWLAALRARAYVGSRAGQAQASSDRAV
jgi:hypothetical protein